MSVTPGYVDHLRQQLDLKVMRTDAEQRILDNHAKSLNRRVEVENALFAAAKTGEGLTADRCRELAIRLGIDSADCAVLVLRLEEAVLFSAWLTHQLQRPVERTSQMTALIGEVLHKLIDAAKKKSPEPNSAPGGLGEG